MSSDQELLHAFRQRQDQSAFVQLFDRHAAMVLATCRRITRDVHEAEDAAQATFIVLARKAPGPGGFDQLGPWLHRVACFISQRQRAATVRRRRAEAAMSRQLAQGAAGEPAPSGDPDISCRLDAALSELPDRYRAPLVLHYLEGRTAREIAERLAIPEDLVATRLSRGRERLRRRLRVADSDVGAALAALTPVTAPPPMPWPVAPSATAQAMATSCLRALWLAPAAVGSAVTVALLLIGIGLVWGLSNAHAEDTPRPAPASASSPATRQPQGLRQPRLSVSSCPLWQERLAVALERSVSLHASHLPALALLDSIGSQCGLTMVVDLPPGRVPLADVSVDADGVPLQRVLDQIAARTGTRYDLYAGSLLWREQLRPAWAGDAWDAVMPFQPPLKPIALRIYRTAHLPAGIGVEDVMADLERLPGIDWSQDGMSIEVFRDNLVLCAQPSQHLAIESRLSTFWHQVPAAAAASPIAIEPVAQGAASSVALAAARRLAVALARPLGHEVRAERVRAALADIAATSGIDVECPADLGDPAVRVRSIPARLAQLAVHDAIALILDGTGLHCAIHAPRAGGADAAAVLAVSKSAELCMATVAYQIPMPATNDSTPEDLMDLIKHSVCPEGWSLDALLVTKDIAEARLHGAAPKPFWCAEDADMELEGGRLVIRQCLEAQLAIEQAMPRLLAQCTNAPLTPTLPALAPIALVPPASASAPVPTPAPAHAGGEFLVMPVGEAEPRQRL